MSEEKKRRYFPILMCGNRSAPRRRVRSYTQETGTRKSSATSCTVSSASASGDTRGAGCVASDSFLVTIFVDIVLYDFSEPTGRPPVGMEKQRHVIQASRLGV